jgi:signal transduction histidine kinase
VVVVSVAFGSHWRGLVLLLLPHRPPLTELRLAQRLMNQLAPVLFGHYLLRRLRSRVAATDRRRIAQELHDGVIQSLAGLELQVDRLHSGRRAALEAAGLEPEIERIQRLLSEETRSVREVMDQIRPLDMWPGHVVETFADLVAQFGRENDIATGFTGDSAAEEMPMRIARELARALQEALRNIRKHGEARHVEVRLTAEPSRWTLVITNDGRPLAFSGRMSLRQLELARLGPRALKERIRELGGDLALESGSERGVTLEISVPKLAHA